MKTVMERVKELADAADEYNRYNIACIEGEVILQEAVVLEKDEVVINLRKALAIMNELLGPAMVGEENRKHLLKLKKILLENKVGE